MSKRNIEQLEYTHTKRRMGKQAGSRTGGWTIGMTGRQTEPQRDRESRTLLVN